MLCDILIVSIMLFLQMSLKKSWKILEGFICIGSDRNIKYMPEASMNFLINQNRQLPSC